MCCLIGPYLKSFSSKLQLKIADGDYVALLHLFSTTDSLAIDEDAIVRVEILGKYHAIVFDDSRMVARNIAFIQADTIAVVAADAYLAQIDGNNRTFPFIVFDDQFEGFRHASFFFQTT